MMNRISLRLRITILMGLILMLLTTVLTIASIWNANHFFVAPYFQTDAYEQMNKKMQDDSVSKSGLIDNSADTNEEISNNISTQVQITAAHKGFSLQSIGVLIAIIVLGLGVTYWIMGRALSPLTVLSETIHDINEHNLNKPIEGTISHDEVGSITDSFNGMLVRLKGAFEQQKHFSASTAHELKTPLATMKTSLQVLQLDDSPSADDYKDTIVVMEQNVDRLISTVNDLLLLSSEGKTELDDEISLCALFCEIFSELKETINEKNLNCTLPQNDCLIAGSYMLLHSAFFNIFENAVKYNKDSGKIDVLIQKNPDRKIIVSICDTGIGMTEEDAEKIFEPFFRADRSCVKELPGNGLGMAIMRTIIQQHGGNIQVESQIDAGTKVIITLDP